MPKKKSPVARQRVVQPPRILQLKISLLDINPPIWRRILLPENCTLGDLHCLLFVAMGWMEMHLHLWRFGKASNQSTFGPSSLEDPDTEDEDSVILCDLINRVGQKFMHEYDFGDGWIHEIKVEKILDASPDLDAPRCLGGMRACPPEDCGGVPGYYRILELLQKPSSKDDDEAGELREWIGDYDPEAFDLNHINSIFTRITRPNAKRN